MDATSGCFVLEIIELEFIGFDWVNGLSADASIPSVIGFINGFFKRSRDYEKVLSTNIHFCFDECNNVHELLTMGKSILDIDTEIESFMHILKLGEINNEMKAHFDFLLLEGTTGQIIFDQGKLTYKKTFEVILYHLIAFKRVYIPDSVNRNTPHKYYISPTRIYFKRHL